MFIITLPLYYITLIFVFSLKIRISQKLLCLCCFHSKTLPENTPNKTRVFEISREGRRENSRCHVCHKLVETSLLRICFDKLATALSQQDCTKLLTSFLQVCGQQPCYSIARTTLLQERQQVATSPLKQAVTSSASTTC